MRSKFRLCTKRKFFNLFLLFVLFVQNCCMFVPTKTQKHTRIMKRADKTLTAKEIRGLDIKKDDVLGLDYLWKDGVENHYLTVNGERVVSLTNSKDQRKSFNKIKRMGFGLGWKARILTDEEQGIIEAGKRGENPFGYSIICADPSLNETVK